MNFLSRLKYTKGFTLVELMMVIAIIGILLAIALPFYMDYIRRAKVTEGFSLASGYKSNITEYFGATGICPNNYSTSVAGIPKSTELKGRWVKEIQTGALSGYAGGVCAIWVSINMDDSQYPRIFMLVMSPSSYNTTGGTARVAMGSYKWSCISSQIPKKYMPANCSSENWQDET